MHTARGQVARIADTGRGARTGRRHSGWWRGGHFFGSHIRAQKQPPHLLPGHLVPQMYACRRAADAGGRSAQPEQIKSAATLPPGHTRVPGPGIPRRSVAGAKAVEKRAATPNAPARIPFAKPLTPRVQGAGSMGTRRRVSALKRDRPRKACGHSGAVEEFGSFLLSRAKMRSIIGEEELNCRVRNGIGCTLYSVAAKMAGRCAFARFRALPGSFSCSRRNIRQNIIDREWKEEFGDKSHGLLVLVSSTPHGASTSSLSTWWSTTALQDLRQGELILRQASRLDAFSGYPFRT